MALVSASIWSREVGRVDANPRWKIGTCGESGVCLPVVLTEVCVSCVSVRLLSLQRV